MSVTTLNAEQSVNKQLNYLYELFNKHQDKQSAKKLIDLYEKHIHNEFIITFAGHFSAGKSSMINKIIGETILPNSPIPTSANIVKIKTGVGDAKVHFNDEHIVYYEAPYQIDTIKDFCTNKSDIHLVELSSPTSHLPKGLTIIDTPGIDATDDYDRQLTEASLHLTDILFYMMDYNHVQSEVNLLFLKQLQTYNIPFYIIINQIDKHLPDEVSFNDYQAMIKQTMIDWQLDPLGIYFTSLRDFTLPNNEFDQLKQTIFNIKDHQVDPNRSFNHLIKDHKQYLQTFFSEKKQTVQISEQEKNSYKQSQILSQTIETSKNRLQRVKEHLIQELNQTLNNAYLMPYDTREQARLYLESMQSDFKVGFFNSRRKTKRERAKRLQDLYDTILTTIDSSMTWSLRGKFKQIVDKEQINNQKIDYKLQAIGIDFTKDHLKNLVHQGAVVNGAYVLNYTKQLANLIKQLFKQNFSDVVELIDTYFAKEMKQTQLSLDKNEELSKQYEQKLAIQQKLYNERIEQITLLDHALCQDTDGTYEDIIAEKIATRKLLKPEDIDDAQLTTTKQVATMVDKAAEIDQTIEKTDHVKSNQLDVLVDETIALIEDLPSFSSIVEDLRQKKERLINRELTIALFGAFSAGKSSFANALMGEHILPSSPNPMTAAITKIHPVTESTPHGTIIVSFKDETTIFNDLLIMLNDFSIPEDSLEQLLDWLQEQSILKNESLNKMVQVYIHAIVSGYEQMKQYFGQQIKVTYDEFNELATNETKASFVLAIDLYYASDLTNQGITLVDTPGADSIHTRHTDVSFNYIKHADTIIYVTYYNHAFSKPDKDFIMQLGRVKESFELDKMFFIVNAADLAINDNELNIVVNHVKDELQNLNVRFPNIYPLSSVRALENKLENNELNPQMQTFEQSLHQFIEHDLTQIVSDAIVWDIKRIKQLFTQHINQATLDHAEKEQMINTLKLRQKALLEVISQQRLHIYEIQMIERIKRQLFYVKDRFYIRFHDLYRDAFNPATIKSGQRQELEICFKQLMSDIQYEFLQEMRAISLRIETQIRQLTDDVTKDRSQSWQSIDKQFLLPIFESSNIESPDFIKGFEDIKPDTFNRSLRLFKNMRSFFEQRESELMKESIYEQLTPYIDQYISNHEQLMLDHYQRTWKDNIAILNNHCETTIDHYIEQQMMMLHDPIDLNILEYKTDQLSLIIEQVEGEVFNE